MANNISEVRRTGIDPTQNVWDTVIYGNPSLAPGYNLAVGSFATQVDSNPPGLRWSKTGPGVTQWTPTFIDASTNTVQLANLPPTAYAPAQRRLEDLAGNELLAAAARDTSQDNAGFIDGALTLRDGDTVDAMFAFKGAALS